ncbi:hypothetical protein FACS189459_5510 [Bacilli bacterium]|nr:hypothetical protein FACS189459_5510 [Bacilli bacterium]
MCVQGLIVVPTKELARQIYNQLVDFKKYEPLLKINLLIGNSDTDEQSRILKSSKPQIIISTPAKALEFIKNKQITKNIKTLIMDEFDMLIDFGFANQIDELFKLINNINLQKICCSATAHESLANKFKKYLTNTKTVSLGDSI